MFNKKNEKAIAAVGKYREFLEDADYGYTIEDYLLDFFFDDENLRKKYGDYDYENECIKFEIINDDFVNMLDDEDTEKLVKAIEYAIEYTLEMISFEEWTEECSIEYEDERSKKDEERRRKNEEDDKEMTELGEKYMEEYLNEEEERIRKCVKEYYKKCEEVWNNPQAI